MSNNLTPVENKPMAKRFVRPKWFTVVMMIMCVADGSLMTLSAGMNPAFDIQPLFHCLWESVG